MTKVNLRPTKNLVLIKQEIKVERKKREKNVNEIRCEENPLGQLTIVPEEELFEYYDEETKTDRCEVIRVGRTVEEVKEGDYCIFIQSAGFELKIGEETYKIIKEEDIKGVIEEPTYN